MVRKAEKADEKVLAKLAAPLWGRRPARDRQEMFRRLLAEEDTVFVLCLEEETPVGFAQCRLRRDPVPGAKSLPAGCLETLFVREESRRKSHGRGLLATCEDWARESGCLVLSVNCRIDGIEGLCFCMAERFQETDRLVCFAKKL